MVRFHAADWWLWAIVAVAMPMSAWAQTPPQRSAPAVPFSRVNLGGGVALPVVFGLGAFGMLSAEARINLNAGTGVTLVTHFAPNDGLAGLYTVGIHQMLGKADRKWSPFLTAGVVGDFEYRKVRNVTRTIKETGDTLVYPSHTGEISKPLSVSAGAGVRNAFADHLAAEFAVQVIPYQKVVGVVFTGNVVLSIGRGR